MAKFAQLCAGERERWDEQTDRWTEQEKNKEEGADGARSVVGGAAEGTWPEAGLWEPVGERERPTEVLMKRIKI